MIAQFESTSQRTLYPAQVEQLLINLYAYRETLVRNAIQYCGLQCLLAFAVYPVLDYLGQMVGLTRLPPQPAKTTLLFTLTAAQLTPTTIAAGTQVGTADGAFIFATSAPLIIPAGATTGYVTAQCTTPGATGNGYVAGQINVLLSSFPLVSTVANTTTSAAGADQETDDNFRARIQAAPGAFTVAGPSNQYKSLARNVSSSLIDVQVVTPVPGTVQLYLLCGPVTVPAAAPNQSGLPSTDLISAVLAALSPVTVRPLCDTVLVNAVTEVDYVVNATVTLYANVNYASVYAGIVAAAQAQALALASRISQDIVPSQWATALSVSGVYSVDLTITAEIGSTPLVPTADGTFVLANGQWSNATAINLTVIYGAKNQPAS